MLFQWKIYKKRIGLVLLRPEEIEIFLFNKLISRFLSVKFTAIVVQLFCGAIEREGELEHFDLRRKNNSHPLLEAIRSVLTERLKRGKFEGG